MARSIFAVFILIFASLLAIYFFIGVAEVHTEESFVVAKPHRYKDADRSIEKIRIFAVYFVPKNKTESIREAWGKPIESALSDLQKFHELQFAGLSKIYYTIYPAPVIGLKESIEYDTETTQGGNPAALLSIAEELDERVFKQTGDLFNEEFAKNDKSAYPVLAIIYEGVGAVGGVVYESEAETSGEIAQETGLAEALIHIVDVKSVDGFFLTNIFFLEDPEGQTRKNSVFAHEFYHTLGVPDGYETPGSYDIPTSQDIMGLGRFRTIEKTYFEKNTLKQLGL